MILRTLLTCKTIRMKKKSISEVLSVTTGSNAEQNKNVNNLYNHKLIFPQSLVVHVSAKSKISLKQYFCLGTGNEQTEVINKYKSWYFLYICSAYITVSQARWNTQKIQLNLLKTWFVWTHPVKTGSDSWQN